jgi:hypothetical protein
VGLGENIGLNGGEGLDSGQDLITRWVGSINVSRVGKG